MDKKINLADVERENERLLADEGLGKLKGIRDVATSVGKKLHSMPPGQGDHDYLDLYLLQKERDRLLKEIALLKKRGLQLGIKISQIDKKVAEKEEKTLKNMTMLSAESREKLVKEKAISQKQAAPKRYEYKGEEWNKFSLEY